MAQLSLGLFKNLLLMYEDLTTEKKNLIMGSTNDLALTPKYSDISETLSLGLDIQEQVLSGLGLENFHILVSVLVATIRSFPVSGLSRNGD